MVKFIDFDKRKKTFYNNLWIDEQKIVIKIPLINNGSLDDQSAIDNFKIEEFDLGKYTYLLHY